MKPFRLCKEGCKINTQFTRKIKILFITNRFENRMEKSSHYLAVELAKHTHLVKWHGDGNIKDILKELSLVPDFILLNDYKYDYCPSIWGLSEIDIPVGAILHDLKYKTKRRNQFYRKENIQHIFTHYRDLSHALFPELTDRLHWLPHHVPLHIFRDYQLPKSINFLMMGMVLPKLYPERINMYEVMKNEPGFVTHSHPGYRELGSNNGSYLIGEDYAKEINKAKMFITCNSADHLPLMKYFEVLACNTLLLANSSKELHDLGFIDGETFVSVDSSNVKEKAYYYLTHPAEREAIAARGYEMVRKRHSTELRVKELIGKINQILKTNKNMP
jgi:hypothetical protein